MVHLSLRRLGLFAVLLLATAFALLSRHVSRPPVDLRAAERAVFSPGGEDGLLERVFEVVHPTSRFLVELGAGDGVSPSCSRNLILNHGWSGLLVEPSAERGRALVKSYEGHPHVHAAQEGVYPGDVELLMRRAGVPHDLDLLIVTLKANDWYVWRAIDNPRPKVVLIQYNAAFVPPQRMVIEYHPLNYWDGTYYFGASIQSLYELGKRKGYELIHANSAGTSLIFVDRVLYSQFRLRTNLPVDLYRRHPDLPAILPSNVWEHVDVSGRPRPPDDSPLLLRNVQVPRRYLIGDL